MKTVFVLGNPILYFDNKPLKLVKKLQHKFPNILFCPFDPTEDFAMQDKEYIFLDSVEGIKKTAVFDNLENFKLSPRNTVHDYDLPVDLIILKKLGKIKKIKVIGIPIKGKIEEIGKELEKILTDI